MIKKISISLLCLIIIQNAGAVPFEVVIETPVESVEGMHLRDSSVGLERLTTEGAVNNDVLFFGGLEWKPAPLTGLTFRGTWNPNLNQEPEIDEQGVTYIKNNTTITATTGDYFIVDESLSSQIQTPIFLLTKPGTKMIGLFLMVNLGRE